MCMLSEALRLQSNARRLNGERENGIANPDDFETRLAQWVHDRKEFAALIPENSLDAVSQLHSIYQAATALLTCRDSAPSVDSLAAELIIGISSQIAYHEQIVGRTCDELALFHDYAPATGVH